MTRFRFGGTLRTRRSRSEEHTSELQSLRHLVCRLLLEKKKNLRFPVHGATRDNEADVLDPVGPTIAYGAEQDLQGISPRARAVVCQNPATPRLGRGSRH